MPLAQALPASSVLRALLVLVLLSTSAPGCHAAHNVTAILSGRRGLAEFSRALTATGLADVVNSRDTVTVLAVDDVSMAALKQARGLPLEALRRTLSRHVLVGYYDDARLRHLIPGVRGSTDIVVPTLLDAPTGSVTGTVRIARERRSGRVAFVPLQALAEDARAAVFYVSPVHDAPHSMSVLLVSGVMWPSAAALPEARLKPSTAPAPAPPQQQRPSLAAVGAPPPVTRDAAMSAQFQASSDAPSRSATVFPVPQATPHSTSVLQANGMISSPAADAEKPAPPEPRPDPSTAAPSPAPPEHHRHHSSVGFVGFLLIFLLLGCCFLPGER